MAYLYSESHWFELGTKTEQSFKKLKRKKKESIMRECAETTSSMTSSTESVQGEIVDMTGLLISAMSECWVGPQESSASTCSAQSEEEAKPDFAKSRVKKKSVTFQESAQLEQVIEIPARNDDPLDEELEPCDLTKMMDMSWMHYGRFPMQRSVLNTLSSTGTSSQFSRTLGMSRLVASRDNGQVNMQHRRAPLHSGGIFKVKPNQKRNFRSTGCDPGEQTHQPPNRGSVRERKRASPLQGAYQLGNPSSAPPGGNRTKPMQATKTPGDKRSTGGILKGRSILHRSPISVQGAQGVQLGVNGESLMSAAPRMLPSPYRQSSGNFGRGEDELLDTNREFRNAHKRKRSAWSYAASPTGDYNCITPLWENNPKVYTGKVHSFVTS
ncbi:hypothetical protein CAPTEDRAFT_226171 [Capitella teleta]|uniref:Uncharacterized protein n=1 Tax=Capitella teleta TaxID=283909 RepID=R7U1N0_CAPTE|nr:hypothetical protein CAPTEDRAFT_226171 [Capitella teleta]|eukprot:ELT97095.1 hypothetical protein CAPTEDRAFT_226171 [Capitella teleta]